MNAIEALRKTTSQTIIAFKWDCCKSPGHNMGCIDFFTHSLSCMQTVRVMTHVVSNNYRKLRCFIFADLHYSGFGGFFPTELQGLLMLHDVLEAVGARYSVEF